MPETAAERADREHMEREYARRAAVAAARTDRTAELRAEVNEIADSSEFVLTSAINIDPDAAALAEILAAAHWPGDSCEALRRLERKLLAALELLADSRG